MEMAKKKSIPVRSKDIPATLGMLHLVRDDLKSEMSALKSEMTARFLGVDSKFSEVKSEISCLKSEISSFKSEMAKMTSAMHQMRLLAEEQRAENRIVMDGLTSLFSRQDRVEVQMASVEKNLNQPKR